MRDPEVEEFLAHTRLAAEGDAKADFERRVDVMREKLLANKGDEMKYSADQERDDHGRFGSADSMSTTALRKHINDVHLYSNPTIDAYGGGMGANRDRKVLLDYHSHLHEDNTDHSHDLVAAAREAVLAPPHPRLGLRDAPEGEVKYSDSQARVPAGQPGGGQFGPGEAYDAGIAASVRAGRGGGVFPDLTAAEDRFVARHGSAHVNHFTQGWTDHATDREHANRPGTPPAVEHFYPAVAERHLANGWWVSQAENAGSRGGRIPVYDLRHQSRPDDSLVFESLTQARAFAQTHPGGSERG